jgi:hypothetical protein
MLQDIGARKAKPKDAPYKWIGGEPIVEFTARKLLTAARRTGARGACCSTD